MDLCHYNLKLVNYVAISFFYSQFMIPTIYYVQYNTNRAKRTYIRIEGAHMQVLKFNS